MRLALVLAGASLSSTALVTEAIDANATTLFGESEVLVEGVVGGLGFF